MAGSTFGKLFSVTTWGESHGPALGAVIDGCPAGLPLCEEDIQIYLDRRKPGQNALSTPRKEDDRARILSGVFEGKTTGTPISIMVENTSQRSGDYREIASYYRPGHADYTFDTKYGFRDYRGGGRSSARETIGRVAGGAIALKILESCGIHICTYTRSIGPVSINPEHFDEEEIFRNPMYMPDAEAAEQAEAYVSGKMREQDSSGGIIECRIQGMPAGIGDPVFDKLNANLAKAVCSIGAVKGFEIGDGFAVSQSCGSINNDAFTTDDNGHIIKKTNHAGGILGGIGSGMPIIFRAAFKPTPSISRPQQTVDYINMTEEQLQIKGRHDPCIVPRAVPCIESAANIAIYSLL